MTNSVPKLLLIVLASVPASAQPADRIHACVAVDVQIPMTVLVRAQGITARMLAAAGVAIDWPSKRVFACNEAPRPDAVKLKLLAQAPEDLHPGALAYAQFQQGPEIVVMFDRIGRIAYGINRPVKLSNILAHVMTHEITHLLQGVARHSETGVMKAHWAPKDFAEMQYSPLPFAPEDIELIRLGMALRSKDLNAIKEPAANRLSLAIR
jgi:hypothetical protein